MEELKEKLMDLLEVEDLNMDAKFTDMEEWDSLASLSIIALLDSDYGIAMSHKDILAFNTIADFCNYVILNKK